jgi:prepilin-type N-terminal cleavage/methylation domain-containing protein
MILFTSTQNSKRGFTLLETLASVAILTITIIGPLSVVITSSSYARQTKDTIVATYLAEDSIELLQNQFDSLYIYCSKMSSSSLCTPASLTETPNQISWRLFKNRFSNASSSLTSSCYENQKPSNQATPGCSFDYSGVTSFPTTTPILYRSDDTASCAYLAEDIKDVIVAGSDGNSYLPEQRKTYKCKPSGSGSGSKTYARSVSIKQLPTFEGVTDGGPSLNQYNDDLLITSTVTFKSYNGLSRSVNVTRFMHSRP